MKWEKVVTRPYYLLQVFYSQSAYQKIPGLGIMNVLTINHDGVIERYLDKSELEGFYEFARNNKNLKNELKKALENDKELKELIKKDPVENFKEFHEKYILCWAYSLLAYYTGFALNQEQIKPFKEELEFIRGEKSVMNLIEGEFFSRLLAELEKKTGLSSELLGYALPDEIMNNKFDKEVLEQRKKYYVWIIKEEKNVFLTGRQAEELEKTELKSQEMDYSDIKEIKGFAASPGIAKGIARILKKPEDVSKVEQGDILVAPMTNPKYAPAMKKAAAFVTDEGGLTCHAAIISREMKKPCIVGTKTATKAIKDGQMIEVDANQGIVRKIE